MLNTQNKSSLPSEQPQSPPQVPELVVQESTTNMAQIDRENQLLNFKLNEDFYIRLIHLNKVYMVCMPEAEWNKPDLLATLKAIASEHLAIQPSKIKEFYLINTLSKSPVQHSRDILLYEDYFIGIQRLEWDRDWCPQERKQLFSPMLTQQQHASNQIKEINRYGVCIVKQMERRGIRSHQLMCPLLDCAKVFPRSCDLICHYNVEIDLKPYACPQCDRAFRRKIVLREHIQKGICFRKNTTPVQAQRLERAQNSLRDRQVQVSRAGRARQNQNNNYSSVAFVNISEKIQNAIGILSADKALKAIGQICRSKSFFTQDYNIMVKMMKTPKFTAEGIMVQVEMLQSILDTQTLLYGPSD